MNALLKIIVEAIVAALWGKVSAEVKEVLTANEVERRVGAKMVEIRKLVDSYEVLIAQGKSLTEAQKDELRKRKVAAQVDLWNS